MMTTILSRVGRLTMHRRNADFNPRHRLLWTAILVLCLASLAHAYDNQDTHPNMTTAAIKISKLDATLKSALSISDGIDTSLPPFTDAPKTATVYQPIRQWLRNGSTDEDTPNCRAINHFHNPLLSFDQSGSNDQLYIVQRWGCWLDFK